MARRLAAVLRIAGSPRSFASPARNQPRCDFQRGAVGVQISARGDAAEDLRDANRSAELFEKEFHVRMYFGKLRLPACSPHVEKSASA